jgi:hypothetical protein
VIAWVFVVTLVIVLLGQGPVAGLLGLLWFTLVLRLVFGPPTILDDIAARLARPSLPPPTKRCHPMFDSPLARDRWSA